MQRSQRKRRILYHTDGRHTHLYQLEPPLTFEQLCLPVDELLGTMVDTLVLSMGGGTTFFHRTKVGTLWGELEEERGGAVWEHLVWYRPSEVVRQLLREGYDQTQVLVDRAHQKGLEFIASIWTNAPAGSKLGDGRLDRFRRDHPEYQIGEIPQGAVPASASKALDFTHSEVREERLSLISEICENYPIDGFELNMEFPSFAYYFKPSEAESKHAVMTGFVRDVRTILDRKKGDLVLAARLPPTMGSCRKLGLDPVTWMKDGLLDIVIPGPDDTLIDMDLPVEEWVEAAKGTGCQVYGCVTPLVNDDRRVAATVEMYRAAAFNYLTGGVDGVYLADFCSRGWPFTPEDYTVLREVGDIDAVRFKEKHYWVRTGARAGPYLPYARQLPLVLEDGSVNEVSFKVSDELRTASQTGILRALKLRIRVRNATPDDRLSLKLNGETLPDELLAKLDFTYRLLSPSKSIEKRLGTHYVYEYSLSQGPFPVTGLNRVAVKVERRDPKVSKDVKLVLHDVELNVGYRIARNYPTLEEERAL